MKKRVKKNAKLSKKELMKKEQVILAEERTLLAYMRTVLSFIGIVFVVAKIYFEDISIFNPALMLILLISGIVLIEEFLKVEKLKRQHGGY
jgi:uncharacterized membrane protein YidH (DUF202 family)